MKYFSACVCNPGHLHVVDGGQRSNSVIRQRPWITAFKPSWQTHVVKLRCRDTEPQYRRLVRVRKRVRRRRHHATAALKRWVYWSLRSLELQCTFTMIPTNQTDFCYVCGLYVLPNYQKKVTDAIQNAYRYCFKSNISNQNKNWVSHTVCANCYRILITCHNSQNTSNLKFISPVVWGKPKSRNDCFFCLTVTKGFNSKNKNPYRWI